LLQATHKNLERHLKSNGSASLCGKIRETSAIGRALAWSWYRWYLGLLQLTRVVNAIYQQNNPVKEEVSETDITLAKAKLFDASKEGKLKDVFFSLKPAMQELLREYANELKKAA
jgi:hypothetical protein